jgi:hypothetical protein
LKLCIARCDFDSASYKNAVLSMKIILKAFIHYFLLLMFLSLAAPVKASDTEANLSHHLKESRLILNPTCVQAIKELLINKKSRQILLLAAFFTMCKCIIEPF